MKGDIFIFSGPSGVGKSSIINELRKRTAGLGYSISHTSRAPRPNEMDGTDYHFVSEDTFLKMREDGVFVEWAKVYGYLYGTSVSSLKTQTDKGLDVILDIDSQGAKNIKAIFKDSILIYILPPSIETLKQRLNTRASDALEVINNRFNKAVEDLKESSWYDYLIINDDLEKAVNEAQSIIVSSRCRRERLFLSVKEMLGI
jgi:guanylate kinase